MYVNFSLKIFTKIQILNLHCIFGLNTGTRRIWTNHRYEQWRSCLYLDADISCKLYIWTKVHRSTVDCILALSNVCIQSGLTDNVECDEVAHLWLRADLTLILSSVTCLYVFDLQRPRVCCFHEKSLETLVRDERVAVHGEDVRVSPSDPGYLQHHQ